MPALLALLPRPAPALVLRVALTGLAGGGARRRLLLLAVSLRGIQAPPRKADWLADDDTRTARAFGKSRGRPEAHLHGRRGICLHFHRIAAKANAWRPADLLAACASDLDELLGAMDLARARQAYGERRAATARTARPDTLTVLVIEDDLEQARVWLDELLARPAASA